MLFLLLFTALALATVTVVCLPLLRGVPQMADRRQFDRIVYRDQLKEVDHDLLRGVLSEAEAGAARLEIQRRLLSLDAAGPVRATLSMPSPRLAVAIAVLVLGGATAIYLRLGAPSLPDAPFAGRFSQQDIKSADNGHVSMQQAAQQLLQKLKADPNNADGWVLYARTESMIGDWKTAGAAYAKGIALGDKSADVLAGYGEMLVLQADGIVPPAAQESFVEAVAADPKNDVARYYLALADSQAGEDRRAIARWLALAADLPEDSPMRESIGRAVNQAAKAGGIAAPALPQGRPAEPAPQPDAAAAQPGPNPQQMAAAAQLPEGERKQMIEGMVTQLAARLQAQPNDLDGWLRLGRSYAVLGDSDKAAAAFQHAVALKPDDAAIKLQEFQALIARLQATDPLPPAAVTLLRQIAAEAPDQPEVLWYLGVQAARDGRPDEARQDWGKLLRTLPPGGQDAKLVQSALDTLPKP